MYVLHTFIRKGWAARGYFNGGNLLYIYVAREMVGLIKIGNLSGIFVLSLLLFLHRGIID